MRKPLVITLLLSFLLVPFVINAQKYTVEKGKVTFFSDGAIEDIDAVNDQVRSIFHEENGSLAFIVKIKDFMFHKPLMREHFNEKYLESEKFPKATFVGKLENFNPKVSGEQKVRAVGKLTIHGIVRDINEPGTVEFANGKVFMKSKFFIKIKDYNIKTPTLVWQNIAEKVEIRVDFVFKTI